MSPFRKLLLIISLTAMWSPSFLFIKLAIQEIPPMTIVTFRVLLAAILMSGLLVWFRRSLPTQKAFWLHAIGAAAFSSAIPFSLFCYAEKTIDSALAAILNGTAPMFTALLAHWFLPDDRLSKQKTIGIFLSIGGLLWLFAPNIQNGLSGNTIGILSALGASLSYAIGHLYVKRFLTKQPTFVVPMAQSTMSFILIAPAACFFEHPWTLSMPSWIAMGGVFGLAFFGTFLAFIIYYTLMEHSGPTAVSMVACFFPAGGMLLGYLFLGEVMPLSSLFAAGLILLGMALVNNIVTFGAAKAKTAPAS